MTGIVSAVSVSSVSAISSEDCIARIEPVEKGIDLRLLAGYEQLRNGASGTIVLLEHHGKGEYSPEKVPGTSRYKTLLELGRLGIENLFVRSSDMHVRHLDTNEESETPRHFVRTYFSRPHTEPSRDELEFFSRHDEEVLFYFLWPQARLLSCCDSATFGSRVLPLVKKMSTTRGDVRDRMRGQYKATWAELSADACGTLPFGAAGVHIHSAGYRDHFMRRLDEQDCKFSVYAKSMR